MSISTHRTRLLTTGMWVAPLHKSSLEWGVAL